jgi:uncharacterized membrane protein
MSDAYLEESMRRAALAYIFTGLAFVMLDAVFLTVVGPGLYLPDISALLADKVKLAPAVLFYGLYVAGVVYFCTWPGLTAGWKRTLLSGVILGLVAYGTYDLTCQAVMKVWTWKITLVDMAWGAFASTAASLVGLAITSAVETRLGRPAR